MQIRSSTITNSAIIMALTSAVLGAAAWPARGSDHSNGSYTRLEIGDGTGPTLAPCFADDRTQLARDSRIGVGRITANYGGLTGTCTAFILSNGAFLTAGHCVDSDNDEVIDPEFLAGQVEFNVPDSTFDGCSLTDSNTRIYPIQSVVDYQLIRFLGIPIPTKDWAVFTVGPDAFGNEPAMVEGFLRPDDGGPIALSSIRVTGYGNDTHPNNGGTCNGNSDAFTLQTDTGILEFFLFNQVAYQADTQGGTSGGPVIQDSTGRVIGIHNTSTCEVELYNSGVAFTKNNLADAVNGFQGPSAVHLDAAGASNGDGTAFDPFDDLAQAVSATITGGKLVIVAGTYPGSATIDREIEIVTPVGAVTLGD